MSTSPVSPVLSPTDPSVSQPSANPAAALGADEGTFLKLLVAQLEYQNPLNPADGIQFVTQLAQFTTLEQQTSTNNHLASIQTLLQQSAGTPAASTPAATTATTGDNSLANSTVISSSTNSTNGMDATNPS